MRHLCFPVLWATLDRKRLRQHPERVMGKCATSKTVKKSTHTTILTWLIASQFNTKLKFGGDC
jgi:hypothetical protein